MGVTLGLAAGAHSMAGGEAEGAETAQKPIEQATGEAGRRHAT